MSKNGNNRRSTRGRRERLSYLKYVVCFVLLIVFAVCLVIGYTRNSSGLSENQALVGDYIYDGNTAFSFDGKSSGRMLVIHEGESTEYKYKYVIHGDQLHLDFKNKQISDADYTFYLDGERLVITGGKGTAGGSYELIKR